MKYERQIKQFIGLAKYDEWGGGYIWGNKPTGNSMIAQLDDFPDTNYEVVNEVLSIRGWAKYKICSLISKVQKNFKMNLVNL